jgi:hypothetical protein
LPHFDDAVPWKAVPILRDHSHSSSVNNGFCEHCGQALPQLAKPYGEQGNSKFGLGVTVVLHIALLLLFLFRQPPDKTSAPPPSGAMMLLAPPAGKQPKPVPTVKPPKLEVVDIQRLANTITLPNEKPIPVDVTPPEPKPITPPPAVDMQALIEARRNARNAANGQEVQESEGDRAMRLIKANVAAANGKSAGGDRNDTGGVFEVVDKSFNSASVKFRGWNPNFKRRWLQQVQVERGAEQDIETAIVKKMIELIRKEKPGDFIWESRRLNRNVPLSARVQDQAELHAFLLKEMFPEYRPPGR